MRLTSTCCVRSGAVCQADAIVQGAELGQRQRTAAIRRASERPAKSLRNWKRPRSEITPLSAPRTHGCWFLYELLFRAYSRLGFGSLNSTDTRRSPVLDGAVWASVLFSLLSKQSCCYVTLRFVTLRFVTLPYATLRYVTLRYDVTLPYGRYVTSRHVTSRHAMSRHVTLLDVTLCHVTPRHVTSLDVT